MTKNYPGMKKLSDVFLIETVKKSGGEDHSIRDICRDVACDVMKIYKKASIHPLSDFRIVTLLQNY